MAFNVMNVASDGAATFRLPPGSWSLYGSGAVELRPFAPARLILSGAPCKRQGDQSAQLTIDPAREFLLASGYDPARSVPVPGWELIKVLREMKPCKVKRGDDLIAPPDEFSSALADLRIEGRFTPMKHQMAAAYFKACRARAFDLSTMRTGKTGSTMLALEWLFRQRRIHRVLILAPLSCVRPVWWEALRVTLPLRISRPLVGTKGARERALDMPTDIYVGNYTAVQMFADFWRRWRPDAVVIDEVTHYANLQTARTKAIRALLADIQPRYVWGLTGTPGGDPLKAFAMSKVVNPDAVAVNTVAAWKDLTMVKTGPMAWQWANRKEAPQYIKAALSPAVLFNKRDLFDLPPVTYVEREAARSSEVERMMKQLKDDMVTVAASGEVITAAQKSAMVTKLLQCAAGAVISSEGTVDLDNKERVEVIKELIGEAEHKVVIFSPFTACLRRLCKALQDSGIKADYVDGSVSESKRTKIFGAFQNDPLGTSIDVLVAHPSTTAFGVELAAADLIIFDGAPLSGDFVFGQAVERLSSVKQTKQVTIAHVFCCREEHDIYKSLLEGQDYSAVVAELFREVTGR